MLHLTLLRCPRSSGGSFRSLTASITAERRSTIFFCVFSDLFDGGEEEGDGDDDEDEARLSLEPPPPPTAIAGREEFSAADLRSRDDGDDIVLARRIAMTQWAGLGLSRVSPAQSRNLFYFFRGTKRSFSFWWLNGG